MILSYLAGGSIVTIEFDATIREDPTSATTVTDYHIERGADIADHARPELDKITVDVVVSNTPVIPMRTNMQGVTGGFRATVIQTEKKVQFPRVLPGVGLITDLLPHSTETTMVNVLNWDGKFSRTQEVYHDLKNLIEKSTLVNLSTHLREWTDMVLTNLSAPRGPADGSCITFSFSAKEIHFVDSQVVAVQADVPMKKSKGAQPAKEIADKDKHSVLDKAADTAFGKKVQKAIGFEF